VLLLGVTAPLSGRGGRSPPNCVRVAPESSDRAAVALSLQRDVGKGVESTLTGLTARPATGLFTGCEGREKELLLLRKRRLVVFRSRIARTTPTETKRGACRLGG